jgi:hypothetical protein
METVSSIRPSYGKYNIVEIENEMGCVVIHLPLHHYELNPIDLLWA